jgi:ferritin-like metal-binding protein YciE
MPLTTQRDLFLHELGDILYVERKLEEEVLPKLIGEVKDTELRAGLKRHQTQTRKHVRNVETAFRRMGQAPSAEPCMGFEGLKREHDKLTSEAGPTLIDTIDTGAAARTEHYEIAAYQSLISMARGLGEKEIVPLLQENLADERETLRELEKVGRRLAKGSSPNGRRGTRSGSTSSSRRRTTTTTRSRARSSR